MVNLASPHLVGDALRARVRRHRRHRRLPDLQGQRAHLLPGNGRRLGHDARRQPELTRTPPGASVLYSTYGLRVPATCVLYVTRGAGQLGPGEALLLRIPASGVPYVVARPVAWSRPRVSLSIYLSTPGVNGLTWWRMWIAYLKLKKKRQAYYGKSS